MKHYLRSSYLLLVYILLYLPLIVIICFSFNNTRHSLLWHGFTWHWYEQLWHNHDLALIALHSLSVGVCAATCATLLGTFAAIYVFRYRFWGKQLFNGLLFFLIIMPDIVIGIALLILFKYLQISLGFWTLCLAHTTFSVPFVFLVANTRLNRFNKNLIEAAKDLRAKEQTVFFRILVPILTPALIMSWLLSFTLSLDDVIVSFFVSSPDYQILPLKIYSMVKLGVSPEINALCTLLLLITLLIVAISQIASFKKQ